MSGGVIRVGIVGLGRNTRERHVPGLRACEGVEITAVCNRSPESTRAAAREFSIPLTFDRWQDLVTSPQVDAVVIGTWPYLHCPITLAALDAGKHVLTEARMAMNADEARRMFEAARRQPQLVTQIVPSPYGLDADLVVKDLLSEGFMGELREVVVLGAGDQFAESDRPLHWRQRADLSGLNMLSLGILHETLIRWVPDPLAVHAQAQTFTSERPDPGSVRLRRVETPDCLHVLTQIGQRARGLYWLSAAARFAPAEQIHLYGSEGTLKYTYSSRDRLFGARRGEISLREIPIPADKTRGWHVEADFIEAICGGGNIKYTTFADGLRYMTFTEAVAESIRTGQTTRLDGGAACAGQPG